MFFKLLKIEKMKLKRSPIWIAFAVMPVIPALLGTLNYKVNIEILKSQWYSLWTQHTLFTCDFFLPILIGIYCSYIMRMEYNNHNWNKVLTMPVSRSMIFLSKLVTVSCMILFSEIWIAVLFVVSGKIVGMTDPIPIKDMIIWCLFGTLGGMVIVSIQLLLSLFIKSFALPVGIAFAGGLSGLVFLAKNLGHIWFYSLMAYGMNSNAPQQMIKSGYFPFVVICILYITLITFISNVILSKKDF